jgi:hemerythrin-like domain-containing protein
MAMRAWEKRQVRLPEDLFARLDAEHAQIAIVADALDSFVESLADDANANLHEIIRFVTFLRGFADGLHHEREEAVLLPTLALAGFRLDRGPLAHIRDQHRNEERLLLEFEKSASAPPPWGSAAIARIVAAANALTSFERSHMAKERELLFPLARKELARHTDALATALARFEESREPRWDAQWLEQLGRELVAQHGPQRTSATQ